VIFKRICEDLEDIPIIVKEILQFTSPNKKFAIYGDMGVGKTTLIKELSLHLGVSSIVNSPTFSILNEYITKNNKKIYHFDFYRLKSEKEAFDIGYEEYFFNNDYCFIEWPENIPNLIQENFVKILMRCDGKKRLIKIIL